jgi:hypothetical protein
MEEAAQVNVLPGSNLDGIDVKTEKRRMASLRGRLTLDESAVQADSVILSLTRLRHGYDSKSFATEAQGNVKPGTGFQIDELEPGVYHLSAWVTGKTRADRQAAHLIFNVAEENLDNMDLHLMRGFEVRGRVVIAPMEGPPPAEPKPFDAGGATVYLSSTRRAQFADERPVPVTEGTGEFFVEGVFPDEYTIIARDGPAGYLQAESYYNGTPVTDFVVKIERGAEKHYLEIYVRPPGGSLDVTVTDGTRPVAGAQVLAVREPVTETALSRLTLRAKTDGDGRATLPRLLTGAYRVVAFRPGASWAYNRDLPGRFRSGQEVKIGGGGAHAIQLRVVE